MPWKHHRVHIALALNTHTICGKSVNDIRLNPVSLGRKEEATCKSCLHMVETQQEYQPRPEGVE